VTCGSLECLIRVRQLMPGRMKLLQCLQIWRLYCLGRRIFAAMAIFLAVSTYRWAKVGFWSNVVAARLKSV
jgi:hypothetical protein